MSSQQNRRSALKAMLAASAAPFVFRQHGHTAPTDTLYHAAFGAAGMAGADINSLTASRNLRLVAVADVDLARTAEVRKRFPNARIYQDWRELLDREKELNSANISTPDHMHAPITMRCMLKGLNVYTQKPLTQSIYEARQLTRVARERRLITQMGIQIHSAAAHRNIVQTIHDGAIGRVREVHSWSNKTWGDRSPRPDRTDPVPEQFAWDGWLGIAAQRPFIGGGYYHPGNWRKRLDFGTGTFGDMGCHILDPVFSALALTSPRAVTSTGGAASTHNWGLDSIVRYDFPGTRYTTDNVTLTWYDGAARPPAAVRDLLGGRQFSGQGSVYIGENGVYFTPYGGGPAVLLPEDRFRDFRHPRLESQNHYLQWVEACRGNGETSTPFSYSGPLTESVLLGCLATRFPKVTLNWDAGAMRITNNDDANRHVRRTYRKGWEVEGL